MDDEKAVTPIDLTTVPLTALAQELQRRRAEWLQVEQQLGLDTPVTPRSKPKAGFDKRSNPKSLPWRRAQAERWRASAEKRGDAAGVKKYEQRIKELSKELKSQGGD